MKKIILLALFAASAGVSFTSCNKDYDCVCTLNGVETNRYSVRASNKNNAEDDCNKKQSSLGTTYQCSIEYINHFKWSVPNR